MKYYQASLTGPYKNFVSQNQSVRLGVEFTKKITEKIIQRRQIRRSWGLFDV